MDPKPNMELWRVAVEINVEGTEERYLKVPSPCIVLVSSGISINPAVVLRSCAAEIYPIVPSPSVVLVNSKGSSNPAVVLSNCAAEIYPMVPNPRIVL